MYKKPFDKFSPMGIDVSSGVEARPGKKDPQKITAFAQAVFLER